jgi:RHS repeat-associated protein
MPRLTLAILLVDTVTHGSGGSASREVWSADPSGMARPGSIAMTDAAGSPLWSTGSYDYDGAGNIKQVGNTTYAYDPFGRLATWTQNQTNASTITSRGYDPFGNYLFTQVAYCGTNPDGSLRCFGQTAAPLEIAGTTNHYTTFTYDGAGNVTAEIGRSYAYDPLNMMTAAQVSGRDFHYLYAADDERIAVVERKPAAGGGSANRITWTVRNFANQLLSEWTDDATSGTRIVSWKEDEIWRGALLLASDAPAGPRHYALDHLGSPRGIRTATLSTSQDFAPFGTGGLLGAGDLQFTSHERDQMEVGDGTADLPDYMHARYYSPTMGRFLSVDPEVATDAPLKPQHWNRYSYAFNSPIAYTDPTGRTVYDQLSANDSTLLLNQLRGKTGLDLYYDSNHVLQSHGQLYDAQGAALGSATARAGLLQAMAPGSTHILQSDPHVWVAQNSGAVTKMNFGDIGQINTGNNPPATFDAASIMIHEMIGHGTKGFEDFPGQRSHNQSFLLSHPNWRGAVVDYDNKIRRELGLPERSQYRTETDRQNRTFIPFQSGPVYLPVVHQ